MDEEQLYLDVRRRLSSLYKIRYGNDWEDALHDTFLIVLAATNAGMVHNSVPFMFGVSRHQWSHHILKQVTRRNIIKLLPPDARPPSPATILQEIEYERIVREEVAFLPRIQREIIERCLSGASRESILSDLGINDNQYRMAKSRALTNMKRLFKKRLMQPWTEGT